VLPVASAIGCHFVLLRTLVVGIGKLKRVVIGTRVWSYIDIFIL
jgi:hypothetical protein